MAQSGAYELGCTSRLLSLKKMAHTGWPHSSEEMLTSGGQTVVHISVEWLYRIKMLNRDYLKA